MILFCATAADLGDPWWVVWRLLVLWAVFSIWAVCCGFPLDGKVGKKGKERKRKEEGKEEGDARFVAAQVQDTWLMSSLNL